MLGSGKSTSPAASFFYPIMPLKDQYSIRNLVFIILISQFLNICRIYRDFWVLDMFIFNFQNNQFVRMRSIL